MQKKLTLMLELQSINSHYGRAHILNDLSFAVGAGEVVSLLGRNGAGKTTTVKSIMQLVKPTAGQVFFEGTELGPLAAHQVAKLGIGYVPDPNLAERRSNRGKALSGGEQQMLSIARTLMGNPRLLLLDEPSEGIAPVIVEQMAKTILTLKKEKLSVLLSEQNLHFARLVSNRAVIIESGEKKYDGTFEELESNPEIRDAYLSV